ncbi:DUF433 domain-containing protein, partial [Bradyrhizobium sp.]|uniref:DUF433 domain-containing protein n=1 Tax=Bradyrhizobium sp. TaxID=376 RepID=UPI00239BEF73|nr:DUF433 domain-containing protein [Bradyrhizobium sp.]
MAQTCGSICRSDMICSALSKNSERGSRRSQRWKWHDVLRQIGRRSSCTREGSASMKQPVVSCTFDIMGGTAVFHGTRVPVQTLLDYLEAGESIDDF